MTNFYKEECHGSDDPFEVQAAMQLITRGDDDTLTPVYDMYNHRNGKWLNTSPKMQHERHDMYASRLKREKKFTCRTINVSIVGIDIMILGHRKFFEIMVLSNNIHNDGFSQNKKLLLILMKE